MKTRVFTIALALCLGVGPSILLAQSSGTSGKIGLVDMQGAILSTAEGKKALVQLQSKYQPRQLELQKLQQNTQAINDQLQKQAATLGEDEQRRLGRDLEEKQKLLKRNSEDANADFTSDRDEIYRRIGQKMVKVINDYAAQNGFSLIIGSDQVPIYYAAKEVELTGEIVKLYDASNPVAAATSGGPAKPATHSGASSTTKSARPVAKPNP